MQTWYLTVSSLDAAHLLALQKTDTFVGFGSVGLVTSKAPCVASEPSLLPASTGFGGFGGFGGTEADDAYDYEVDEVDSAVEEAVRDEEKESKPATQPNFRGIFATDNISESKAPAKTTTLPLFRFSSFDPQSSNAPTTATTFGTVDIPVTVATTGGNPFARYAPTTDWECDVCTPPCACNIIVHDFGDLLVLSFTKWY
jgi:hypothetical protein